MHCPGRSWDHDSILAPPYLELSCVMFWVPSFLGRHYGCWHVQGKQPCEDLSHEKKMEKLGCSAKNREDPVGTCWLSGMQKRDDPVGLASQARTRNEE